MKIKDRHFPYPVLSPFSDDIVGEPLKAEIEAQTIENGLEFKVTFQLENEALQQLIATGQAVYAVHLECSSTMKRFYERAAQPIFIFTIDQKLLNNVVEINFFIVANEDIYGYHNTNFHKDFEGAQFNIQKGDQLAFTETVKMNITKEPIAKTNSIFELAINPLENAPLITTDFEEKIVISIPKSVYEEITNLRGLIGSDVDQLLISMYYMPALIEGLYYIRDLIDNDEIHFFESTIWYRSIAKRLETLGTNIEQLNQEENIPDLAMQILDNVNERGLVSIARIFGIEEEGEFEE
ncbi:hypothetical protein [Lysinibacillus tabacifolii]|uniref:Uncharacterized protein n=1 Tax=Lysinibacillus tabacifolii TaxID=1173107 RepID=A0ABY2SUY6_9BACI|nr:hypothetical protein [Lysinibacillus tabacifolii]TKI46250.1 hypothetical protein FC748_18160 [Lysinibacillus tabacifolii]